MSDERPQPIPAGAGPRPARSRRRAAAFLVVGRYLSVLLNVVRSLAFVPLYLRYFSLSTYGSWLATGSVLRMFGNVDMGLSLIVSQRLSNAYGKGDDDYFREVVGAGAVLLAGLCCALALGALGIAASLPRWVNAKPDDWRALTIAFDVAVLGALAGLVRMTVDSVVQAWQETFFVGLLPVVVIASEMVVTLLCLFQGLGVISLGVGMCAAALGTLVLSLLYTGHRWRAHGLGLPLLRRERIRELLREALPLIVSRTVGIVVSESAAVATSILASPTRLAVLTLTGRPFLVGASTIHPFAGALLSTLAHLHGASGSARIFAVLTEVMELTMLLAALTLPLALAFNEPFITLWVGPEKFGGHLLCVLLFLDTLLQTRSALMTRAMTGLADMGPTAWAGLAQGLLRLPIMIGLLLVVEIKAIPLASLISYAAVGLWFFPRRLSHVVGCGFGQAMKLQAAGWDALLISCGLCVAFRLLAPHPGAWLIFTAELAALGLLVGAGLLLFSPSTRRSARQALAIVRRGR